jgi:DNA-binding response OmpR family regulator
LPTVASAEAADAALRWPGHLIVLDVGLPGMDGLSWLKRLRARRATVSAGAHRAGCIDDRVHGLKVGADATSPSPSPPELVARVYALAPRASVALA